MFSRTELLEIISGKRRGFRAALLRFSLGMLTPIYRIPVAIRNWRFDQVGDPGPEKRIRQAQVPVISVGNLTTGGTGKTPMVIWLARHLRQLDLRVGLISRGYGSDDGRNDEAREMENRLPDVPHLQDPDRYRMAEIAVEELESEILVLDDGFQHRQLYRDFDLVLIDATCPFGFERLLPRGILREPITSLRRADAVVITRVNLVSDIILASITARIRKVDEAIVIYHARTNPRGWIQHDGSEYPLTELLTKEAFVVCAIGNPENYLRQLDELTIKHVGHRFFDDHHEFQRDDLPQIEASARAAKATCILCTHKDLVKLGVNSIGGLPLFALLIDIAIEEDEQTLLKQIQSAVHR